MILRTHAIISGRVQGVGFRYTAKQKADELGVTGWIRNNEDGTVELDAEGNMDQVDQFIQALKNGLTPVIRVEQIDQTSTHKNYGYRNFSIKN
ncbi:acylphosphatase [Virgibacillus sp. M23]|nr:acylphosphatase [Virgibacillus sp. M23]MDY7042619.1 acylphosphatase [Virgibacillus sp. M23]